MIAITVFYTILETVLTLLLQGAIYIANGILDESITLFTANQDFFASIFELLPFGNLSSTILGIVKGISYGIAGLLIIFSIFKSITNSITNGQGENSLQAFLRGALAIILIITFFGINLTGNVTGTGVETRIVGYNGLIRIIGQWFSTVLSYLEDITHGTTLIQSLEGIGTGLVDLINTPASYLGICVLYAGILTSVIGAAITYVERMLSFAVYVLIGPIAVSLYASPDTSDTFKQWVMGLFTQFIAIFISMIMWVAFLNQMAGIFPAIGIADGGTKFVGGNNKIFMLAVAIGLLNLMKDSEKILNSLGLKTMQQGACARSVLAGAGAIASGAMMSMQAGRAYRMNTNTPGTGYGREGGEIGTRNPFDSNGNLSEAKDFFHDANGNFTTQNLHDLTHTMNPVQYYQGYKNQQQGIKNLHEKINSGQTITGDDINKAQGWGENSRYRAVGEFNKVSGTGKNGEAWDGLVGTIQDRANGKTINHDSAFVSTRNLSNNESIGARGFVPDYKEYVNSQGGEYETPRDAGSNLNNATSSEVYEANRHISDEDF